MSIGKVKVHCFCLLLPWFCDLWFLFGRKEKQAKWVPSIEQYTQTDRKRTESVLHSLSSFFDNY